MGIKMGRPDLNVVIVAGDGDFLSIGGEHIGPQAARNLNVCAVVMDNGVYGLTKGQSSPTTKLGTVTSSTPYGKIEEEADPLELYLTLGASFVASGFSGQPRQLAELINQGMDHQGFAMVHVQSPCTTYNDTFMMLKGNPRQGIEPLIWDIPEDHDPSDKEAARDLLQKRGLPIGVLFKDENRPSLEQRLEEVRGKARQQTVQQLMDSFEF
jgi:2-oxoglutarate ferredoxin oxidoreductase subunit beta